MRLKVSELGLANGRWDEVTNRAVIRETISIFGLERCMFASNLPVSELSVPLDGVMATVLAALPDATQAEIDGLFAGNARRFYWAAE